MIEMNKIQALIGSILLICLLNCISVGQSSDSSDLEKYEIGGQFTLLRRKDASTVAETFRRFGFPSTADNPPSLTELGLGARFTYNISKTMSVEAEFNFFPSNKRSEFIIGVPVEIVEPGGRKFQTLFGPKIGYRGERFGVYGKIRPGFVRFGRYQVVTEIGPPSNPFVFATSRKKVVFFNVDVGGVFEYYPTRKTLFRVDVGDTIIRYRSLEPVEINPSFTRHNPQISAGFGFRF